MSEHLSGLRRHQSNKKENFAKFFDPEQVWVSVLEVGPGFFGHHSTFALCSDRTPAWRSVLPGWPMA
jgi:hypothetical protein